MKKFLAIAILVLFVITLFGCTDSPTPPAVFNSLDDSEATTTGVNETVLANNQFAFDLFSFVDNGKNVFYSPYSISTALAMTYEGAKGQTATEMQNVFHFPESNILRPSNAKLYNLLNEGTNNYELKTANALWAQKDYVFLQDYFDIIKKYYGGEVTNLDFVNENAQAVETINSWVEEQTNDKIKDILSDLSPETRLVLANAIYFKGQWLDKFDVANTKPMNFRKTPTEPITVQMMNQHSKEASYSKNEDWQMLKMPYKGDVLSMIVMLPKDETNVSSPTLQEYNELKSKLHKREIEIYFPKFKFETKYLMNDALFEMGMPTAFTWPGANFSGMTGNQDLFISQVIHQTFIEVDEEGTEAAAATVVVMATMGMPLEFKADHPFYFFIQEKTTGEILFMGKVNDPTSGN